MPMPRQTTLFIVSRRSPRRDTAPLVPHGAADATRRAEESTGLSAIGRELLEAQKLMLSESATEDAAARLESASRIAANVLRHHGRSLDVTDLEGPLQSSLVAGNAEAMIEAIDRILEGLAERPSEPAGTLAPQAPEATLRVDVDRIDTLVRLTGELLIAKNAIGHSAERAAGDGDPRALAVALKNQHLALDRLVSAASARGVQPARRCRCSTPSSVSRASSGKWPLRSASRRA